ncbi:hypothetical protein SAMN04488021_11573 [Paracoccus aminovorans]|uniref:Uncharacterized protein n=1 Tax=Paracoccus aminovorans TaxID=34004 RepID=A0A1I3AKB0_9RHOB|nr:hypothetical protein [Paracoccus aminovorans]CQR86542.1 hypothetical protein JCM7685_1979 [Paracoccus aminovorans]SFH50508.1 hypothetical protein SAMN04488021_11573 [Paracoccus aminovorans]
MLWLLSGLVCLLAARLAAVWLCLSHRYPEWRTRRSAERRASGPLAFAMLHANPLFDGQGFLDWHHPRNRRTRIRFSLMGVALLALAFVAHTSLFSLLGNL